jgi:hypothetical protein
MEVFSPQCGYKKMHVAVSRYIASEAKSEQTFAKGANRSPPPPCRQPSLPVAQKVNLRTILMKF